MSLAAQPRLEKLLALRALSKPAAYKFDNAIDHHANPEIHQQTEVELVGTMLCLRGQVRHQQQKIDCIADHDGNELFEQAAGHVRVECKSALHGLSSALSFWLLALRQIFWGAALAMSKEPLTKSGIRLRYHALCLTF